MGTVRVQGYELKWTTLRLSHGWHGALPKITASMRSHHCSDSTTIHHEWSLMPDNPVNFHVSLRDATAETTRRRAAGDDGGAMGAPLV